MDAILPCKQWCADLALNHTLRDYKHLTPSRIGFTTELDFELLEEVSQQKPQHLAQYVAS